MLIEAEDSSYTLFHNTWLYSGFIIRTIVADTKIIITGISFHIGIVRKPSSFYFYFYNQLLVTFLLGQEQFKY